MRCKIGAWRVQYRGMDWELIDQILFKIFWEANRPNTFERCLEDPNQHRGPETSGADGLWEASWERIGAYWRRLGASWRQHGIQQIQNLPNMASTPSYMLTQQAAGEFLSLAWRSILIWKLGRRAPNLVPKIRLNRFTKVGDIECKLDDRREFLLCLFRVHVKSFQKG